MDGKEGLVNIYLEEYGWKGRVGKYIFRRIWMERKGWKKEDYLE